MGFPGGSDGKESACKMGDLGSIPGSGRSPGEENSYPLQYSCLENSMDRSAWWATVHGVAKSWTQLSNFHFTFFPLVTISLWVCFSSVNKFICTIFLDSTYIWYSICLSLSDLPNLVGKSLGPSMLLQMALFYFLYECFVYIYKTSFLSIHLLIDI